MGRCEPIGRRQPRSWHGQRSPLGRCRPSRRCGPDRWPWLSWWPWPIPCCRGRDGRRRLWRRGRPRRFWRWSGGRQRCWHRRESWFGRCVAWLAAYHIQRPVVHSLRSLKRQSNRRLNCLRRSIEPSGKLRLVTRQICDHLLSKSDFLSGRQTIVCADQRQRRFKLSRVTIQRSFDGVGPVLFQKCGGLIQSSGRKS